MPDRITGQERPGIGDFRPKACAGIPDRANRRQNGIGDRLMRFGKLDLNLLVAFDTLAELRSVSAAARKLNLTQSAVSGALNRLRVVFEDELLVRHGRAMILTPKAEALAEPVRSALMLIRSTVMAPVDFIPGEATQHFRIICSDYVLVTLVSPLIARASRIAPGITFSVASPGAHALRLFEKGEIDLFIALDLHVNPKHPWRRLFGDEAVAVSWTGNTKIGARLDLETFRELGQVSAVFGEDRYPSFFDVLLRERGVGRRVEVEVDSFGMIPHALVNTDRVAVMHARLARHMAQHLPLRIMPLPLELPKVTEVVQWHKLREKDPGVSWLISQLVELAAEWSAEADQ